MARTNDFDSFNGGSNPSGGTIKMEENFEAGNCKISFECGKCGEKNVQGFRFLSIISSNGRNNYFAYIRCENCDAPNYIS